MPGLITHHTAVELILVALAVVLVVSLVLLGYRAWQRSRVTAEERERRRCAQLVAVGKITDAMLVEIRENLVFYSYSVRGVEYTASQDLARFVGEAREILRRRVLYPAHRVGIEDQVLADLH